MITPRLSGHITRFGLVFFVLKSPLGFARQWSHEKIATLSLKPWRHVRILTLFLYQTCVINFSGLSSLSLL